MRPRIVSTAVACILVLLLVLGHVNLRNGTERAQLRQVRCRGRSSQRRRRADAGTSRGFLNPHLGASGLAIVIEVVCKYIAFVAIVLMVVVMVVLVHA